MTIHGALTWATHKLALKKIDSASLDAEVLLSAVIKKPKEFLFTHPEIKLTAKQLIKFYWQIYKRGRGLPVAYLSHHKEFFGYNFYINHRVLVPRPLTEQLISIALAKIKNLNKRPLTIVDVGTGSGNIIITLAKELQKTESLDNFKFYGLDVSFAALKVAKKNANTYGLTNQITFIKSDLLEKFPDEKIDLVLANLPYLNQIDVDQEPSIQKEPQMALVGNLYPKLFTQIDLRHQQPLIIWEDKNGVNQKEAF